MAMGKSTDEIVARMQLYYVPENWTKDVINESIDLLEDFEEGSYP